MGTSDFGGHFAFWTHEPLFIVLVARYTKFDGCEGQASRVKVTSGLVAIELDAILTCLQQLNKTDHIEIFELGLVLDVFRVVAH